MCQEVERTSPTRPKASFGRRECPPNSIFMYRADTRQKLSRASYWSGTVPPSGNLAPCEHEGKNLEACFSIRTLVTYALSSASMQDDLFRFSTQGHDCVPMTGLWFDSPLKTPTCHCPHALSSRARWTAFETTPPVLVLVCIPTLAHVLVVANTTSVHDGGDVCSPLALPV